ATTTYTLSLHDALPISGERVRVMGWLHSLRQLGGINFLVIRDGWGIVQAVAETEDELIPLREGEIGVESVLAVEGLVVSEAQARSEEHTSELQSRGHLV